MPVIQVNTASIVVNTLDTSRVVNGALFYRPQYTTATEFNPISLVSSLIFDIFKYLKNLYVRVTVTRSSNASYVVNLQDVKSVSLTNSALDKVQKVASSSTKITVKKNVR